MDKRDTEARHAREAEKIKAIRLRLDGSTLRAVLASKPHPSEIFAAKGKTRLDYIEFIWAVSGDTGRIAVGKMLDKELV